MKKILYPIVFLLITFSDTYAQNWECIKTDDEYYYGKFQTQSNPDATTRMVLYETIKIDSVYTELDNLVYQNHKAVESTPSCHYTNGPSFLGKKVYSDIQGYFHFINDSTDTLHIKSNAIKDENWVFYLKSSSNLKIIAYIDTIVYDSLFFLPDSVKVIKFYAQNLQGDSIQHTINNKSMKLTKNHGLNSIFDLLKFPETITNYNLVGTKNTNKGYKNFGAAEIWDMEIGDEFHLVKDEGNVSYTGYIRKLIGKQKIGNVLYLNFEEWSTNFFGTTAATILPYRVFTKTIDFENPMIMRWNSLPGESYATDYHGGYFKIYSSPDSVLQEKSHSYPELYRIDPSTDCFYQDIDLYGWTYHHYAIKGAGDDYYRGVYSVQYTEIRTFALKYFKKGDKKYGIPYDYASVMGWSPFNSLQKYFFGRNIDTNTIRAEQQLKFRPPSLSHISASYKTIGLSNSTCWAYNKIGIFGKDILTDQRGTYNLINNHNDTIIFKAYTPLNHEWLFYKNETQSLVIKAKCKSEEIASIFGKSDSIRSYSFQAYDLNGVPVDHPVNSKVISLSHNSGFLSTFDFYYFPDSLESNNYTLNGYTEFNAIYGNITSNLSLQDAYNINVGDRIDLVNTTTFEGGQTITETIKFLIAKTGSSVATLNLDFRVLSKITTYYNQGDSIIQYLQDTITQTIDFTDDFTAQFNKEVGNIMEVDGGYKIAHLEKSNQLYNGRLLKEINPVIFTNNDPADSCMNATTLDCAYYYINNLGGPYEKCTNAAYSSIDRLVAFQSSGSVWGTPLSESDVLGIEKNDPVNALIAVYPNPAKDILNISISDFKNSQWNFEIYNAYGMQIMSAPLSKTNNEINIEKFASGVYIYRIINEQGSTEGKFIKE